VYGVLAAKDLDSVFAGVLHLATLSG